MNTFKHYTCLLLMLSSLAFSPASHAAWWNDVGNWFVDTATDVGNWFVDAAEDVGNWFEGAFNDVTEAFSDAADFFEDVAQTIEDEIVDTYNAIENEVSEWFVIDTANSPGSETHITVASYDLNTSSASHLSDFRARQNDYLNNSYNADLLLDASRGVALNPTKLADALQAMIDSKNSDFDLLVFVRILYMTDVYDSEILAAIDQLPRWVDDQDGNTKVYNSENHLIMWMVANWLLDQRAGVTPSAYERRRLEHWLDLKIQYGYYEYMSLTYAPYTLAGLLNLYDFVDDAELKEKARKAALIMLHDMMLTTNDQGIMVPVSGRAYGGKYEDSQRGQTLGKQVTMLTGVGDSQYNGAGPVDILALTTLDVSPATRTFGEKVNVRYRIGHASNESFVDNLHSGLNANDKALFQMSAGAYAHPDFLADMLAMLASTNIDGNDAGVGILSAFIGGPLDPIISGGSTLGGAFTYSSLLMDQTLNVYKDGGAMLSSLQNYHGGRTGWQQTPWSATVGSRTVFTRTGSGRGGWNAGGQGMMNTHLPYITQTDNVALIVYKAKPELRLVDSVLDGAIEFELDVNLFWPQESFDETATNGNWIFGREGDNYIGVFRHCLNTRTITVKDTQEDIMSCSSNQQVWATVVGTAESHQSFVNFVSIVSAAEIRSEWNWDLAGAKHVWQTTLSVDGVQISRNIDRNIDDLVEGDTWELGSIVNTSGLSIDSSTLAIANVGGHTIQGVDENWHNVGLSSCSSSVHLHGLSSFYGIDPTVVRTTNTTSETPLNYANWDSGEPNNSGGEDCAVMRTNGKWNDTKCGSSYRYACRNDHGKWAVTSSSGAWTNGMNACRSLGGSYAFQGPVNADDNEALRVAAAGKTPWININDGASEGAWRANRGGSCQVMAQEDLSLDTEFVHADEDIDFISFTNTEFHGGEAGKIVTDHNWHTVNLQLSYERPVVFASINTYNGGHTVTPEIRNITPTSFEVRAAEFEHNDYIHAYETISYVVMNAGEYDLGDGRFLEVGTAALTTTFDGSPNFENIGIGLRNYQLITQVQGNDRNRILGTRITNKNPGSFDASLMVQERDRSTAGTVNGVVGYMALGERNYQLTTIKVALKGVHGKYFVAEGNGGGDANANRSAIGSYETFSMISANDVPGCIRDGDNVAFLAGKGYYMKGHSGGNVTFDRSVAAGVDTWETWRLDNDSNPNGCLKSGDKVFLTVEVHGKRLQANSNGDARLSSNWGSWERQEVIFIN